MKERWEKQAHKAFQFWHQLFVAWEAFAESKERYQSMISHLKRFERRCTATFKFIIERKADPVYVLHVLISLCDEDRVKNYIGLPQVMTQEKSGSLSNLQDFRLITESDLRTIEETMPTYQRAGIAVDQPYFQNLRRRFDALPDPPSREGYTAEKASLSTDFHIHMPVGKSNRGRPGEHYFNTAMVLLAKHFRKTTPQHRPGYSSIALLLNAFCPTTYESSPLSNELVRQRISSAEDRVQDYCGFFEKWFDEWKRFIQQHPIPFNPWQT